VFVQYFGQVEKPFREVAARLPALLTRLDGWAQDSYRRGERLQVKIAAAGVAKTVRMRVGEPISGEETLRLPVTWEAAGATSLFPEMSADMIFSAVGDDLTQVKFQGTYEPPLGSVGRLLDRAMLHRVAEASVKNFVDRIITALEG